MLWPSSWAVLLLTLLSVVAAWEPDFTLRISNATISPSCQPRNSVLINGTYPGPLLRMTEGGHYWIRVYNDLPDQNTTIHLHGFTQFGTPFSDGTPLASQWPIPPGRYFDYEFQLEDGFHGTYWYHSHVDMQSMTALGPIIIDPKDKEYSPVEYDEELIMLMSDFYHTDDETMFVNMLNLTSVSPPKVPEAIAVNGRAVGTCNSTLLNPGQTCTDQCGNHQQFVKPGKKYRLRIIAGSILAHMSMSLEGHTMTLFEADGTYLEPTDISHIEIAPGQRYSVLIETMDNPPKKDFYWRLKTIWRSTSTNGSALWTYDDDANSTVYQPDGPFSMAPTPADLAQTVFLPNETFGWISDDLSPWQAGGEAPTTEEVTRTIYLDTRLVDAGVGGKRWTVNDVAANSTSPAIPYLVSFYSKPEDQRVPNYAAATANGGLDSASNTYPVKLGEVIDIVLRNYAGVTNVTETHPWHLHGAKFWDMGAGMGEFTYAALSASLSSRKGRPFQRDTSVLYGAPGAAYSGESVPVGTAGGWRVFRIVVTDPGLWLIHCHLLPHQVMGMAANILFGAEDLPPVPKHWLENYFDFGGAAYVPSNETSHPVSYFEQIQTV